VAEYVKIARVSDLPSGKAKNIEVKGAQVALYNVGGKIFATAGSCPHRGGPLGDGDLEAGTITCPWHGFQFDVRSGACLTNAALGLACHPVRTDGDDILVEV
jgi:nitrite reductase/ring-hydroxylating ferredoxin subunit